MGCPLPELSATDVPLPSLNRQYAIRPAGSHAAAGASQSLHRRCPSCRPC